MKSKEEIKLEFFKQFGNESFKGYPLEQCHAIWEFFEKYIQCQEDMADKKYTEKDSRIVKIYNKRLKKYWECSYGAFLKRWGNNGWAIVNK